MIDQNHVLIKKYNESALSRDQVFIYKIPILLSSNFINYEMPSNSLIYTPFRSLGLICDEVPPAITKLGDDLFFTISCGHVFQVYRSDKLQVVLISKPAPGEISHLCTSNHDTFVSVENAVYRYRRAHLMNQVLECPGKVKGLLCVGEALLCYDEQNNLFVSQIKTLTCMRLTTF